MGGESKLKFSPCSREYVYWTLRRWAAESATSRRANTAVGLLVPWCSPSRAASSAGHDDSGGLRLEVRHEGDAQEVLLGGEEEVGPVGGDRSADGAAELVLLVVQRAAEGVGATSAGGCG